VNKNCSSKNCWKMSDGSCDFKVPVCNEMDLLTEIAFRRRSLSIIITKFILIAVGK